MLLSAGRSDRLIRLHFPAGRDSRFGWPRTGKQSQATKVAGPARSAKPAAAQPSGLDSLDALQVAIGNQSVGRLIQAGASQAPPSAGTAQTPVIVASPRIRLGMLRINRLAGAGRPAGLVIQRYTKEDFRSGQKRSTTSAWSCIHRARRTTRHAEKGRRSRLGPGGGRAEEDRGAGPPDRRGSQEAPGDVPQGRGRSLRLGTGRRRKSISTSLRPRSSGPRPRAASPSIPRCPKAPPTMPQR